jgi:hypothetical protein
MKRIFGNEMSVPKIVPKSVKYVWLAVIGRYICHAIGLTARRQAHRHTHCNNKNR